MAAFPLPGPEETLRRIYSLLGEAVLLPIPLNSKAPEIAGWQTLTLADSDRLHAYLLTAVNRGGNIGVLLGPTSSRLFALDLDDDSLIEQWLTRVPWLREMLRTKGKRGCQFFFRLEPGCEYPNGKAIYQLKENGKVIGELRLGGAGGAQSVIYGIHPDGMRYQVVVVKSPLVISLANLDELVPGSLFTADTQEDKASQGRFATDGNSARAAEIWERVIRYLDKCDPAIDGQRGHDTTYRVLCQVVNGFALSPEQAWEAALYYNQKCEPPWSDKELKHKVDDALKSTSKEPRGHLLDSENEPPLSRKLKGEQSQRKEAEDECGGGREAQLTNGQPIDLQKESEERFRQYLTDPEPFPAPMRPEAFHGILGGIVRLMSQHCESSPEVLLLHGLVIIGNILGRSAYVHGGGPKLFPNEYAVCVGETARGRKGTAHSMWEHLIATVNPDWLDGCLARQTQTGEGIVHRVRDERYGVPPGRKRRDEPAQEVLLDEGVSDKRLLILEEEFSHVLKMAQRSGNTLSEILRVAWDSPSSLRTSNKNSPLKASDPHVSLIGHTTKAEILESLKEVDLNNGMANRVLWCAAQRTGDMPDAEPIFWHEHPDIMERLRQIFRQHRPNTDEPVFFRRSPEAKNYWDALYRRLNAIKQSSTLDAILARDTSHILKVALIFAISDQANEIERQHLEAALAVVDFCCNSARWIFGRATGNKLANNILLALRRSPGGLTRTEIQKDVCYGSTPKSQLDTALAELAKNKLAKVRLENAAKGPRVERWFATT
jgi:hypothetical protein